MNKPRQHRRLRLLVPSTVLCAFVLALLLATAASAETRVGEITSPADLTAPAEGDIVAASASYESTTGTVTTAVTTRGAPGTSPGFVLFTELVTSPGLCSMSELGFSPFPAVVLRASYAQTEAEVYAGTEAEQEPHPGETTGGIEGVGYAPKTVSGTTTTLTETAPQLLNRPYNCVLLGISRQESGGEVKALKTLLFPIAVKPAPPTTVTVPGPPTTITAPAPTLKPGLAFPKAAPLTLGRERWTTVRVKVSNPGTGAIGPVTIKAKAPKGVRLEPATLKLPALLPGQTWPAAFRMEITDAAAAKSKITLTATASGLTATGSVPVKPTG
jgi:hypothetical protein